MVRSLALPCGIRTVFAVMNWQGRISADLPSLKASGAA